MALLMSTGTETKEKSMNVLAMKKLELYTYWM